MAASPASIMQGPPVTETPPKRGPGRPKGSRNSTASARPRTGSLETQIAATLMAMNLGLMLIPPLQRDALDEMEIRALAKALDSQAKTSPRFRKMLEGALAVTSGGQLLGVAMIIGARRAARHGLVPAEMDGMLGAMLAAGQHPAPSQPTFANENGTE